MKEYIHIIFFFILLIIIVLNYKLEGFADIKPDLLGLSYLGLEEANYPAQLDTYFINNSPISDSGILSRQKDTKFCNNNTAINYREKSGQTETCNLSNDIVNNIFTLDMNSITDHFINKTIEDLKEFETKYINTIFKPKAETAMQKYATLQNDIILREKMINQNEDILSRLDKMNNKLTTERDDIKAVKTDEIHLINEYTANIASNKDYNKKLKKYIKYISVIIAFVIIYLMFHR